MKLSKKKMLRFTTGLALGLSLAALVAFNTLLIWVATGPRSLNNVTPYIEQALAGNSNIKAKIGQTWLLWDGWENPIDIRLKDVSLLTQEGVIFSSFPEISLGVDVLSLPLGKILPTSLSVSKPVITIPQKEDKSFDFGVSKDEKTIDSSGDTLAVLVELLVNPHANSSFRKLRYLELLNANIRITDAHDNTISSAPDTTLIIRRDHFDTIDALIRGTVEYGDHVSPIEGDLHYTRKKKRLEGKISATDIKLATLLPLFSENPFVTSLQFPVSGEAIFALNESGVVDTLKLSLEAKKGKLSHEHLAEDLKWKHLSLEISASQAFEKVHINKIDGDLYGSKLAGALAISQKDQKIGVQGDVSITNVDTNQAGKFWPVGLAPLSREWVTTNIREGKIEKAEIKLDIKPGDLDKEMLPKEAVDASILLRGAEIRYLPDHPKVREVDADIHVDGQALNAAISKTSAFTDTRMTDGRVVIADLIQDNPLIEVSLHADAAASDIVTLLGLPMLEHAKNLNLESSKISGRATGDAKLGFYFFAEDEAGNPTPITYDISAQAVNISTPKFLGKFDIAGANGTVDINTSSVTYKGVAEVNGTAVKDSEITYFFSPVDGVDTTIHATTNVSDAALKRFNIELPVTLPNPVSVVVDASLSTQGAITAVPSLSVKGEGINVIGKLALAQGGEDVASVTLDKLRYGRTELSSLEYGVANGVTRIYATGKSLDLSHYLEKEGDGEGFSFEAIPALDISLDVARMYAANEKEMTGLKASMKCSKARCSSADIRGNIGEDTFSFVIKPEGRNRRLLLDSSNAGELLQAVDILTSMHGGKLSLIGLFNDAAKKGQLDGVLNIHDYTLVDAPILAKMLTLASLTGFFDTLSGNGIAFSKMRAPFSLHHDVLTLKEAKSHGAAMGLTADGTITFPATSLKLEGTIVPSYTLNNVVGVVPVVGDLLTGGEGEGIFAARYTLTGDSDNPDVSVNPLSMLTPGFLRNLFDAF